MAHELTSWISVALKIYWSKAKWTSLSCHVFVVDYQMNVVASLPSSRLMEIYDGRPQCYCTRWHLGPLLWALTATVITSRRFLAAPSPSIGIVETPNVQYPCGAMFAYHVKTYGVLIYKCSTILTYLKAANQIYFRFFPGHFFLCTWIFRQVDSNFV